MLADFSKDSEIKFGIQKGRITHRPFREIPENVIAHIYLIKK
jgi:hypothetical protein